MRAFLPIVVAAAVVPAVACFAQTKPDGTKVLDQAREALSHVDAMSYEATVVGERGLEAPAVKARVSMAKAEAGGWRIYTKGTSGTNAFEVAYDGAEARSVRETEKVVYRKTPRDESDLMVFFSGQNAKHPVAWELIAEKPLPVGGGTPTIEGEATVGGVKCEVVKVPGAAGADAAPEADYGYVVTVATTDHLPRRIERLVGMGGAQSRVLTMSDFKVNGESMGAPYTLAVPDGFAVRTDAAKIVKKPKLGGGPEEKAPKRQAGKVDVGDAAPAWTLKDSKGKDHSLADYKGKVVVIDFWATWCGWCIKGMPAVQKVHTKFKGKDVVVLGVAYNETGDPEKFMQKNRYTYGLLLGGEELQGAYGINGIPAMFIVGKDGKILWRADGYSPDHEKHMTEVIKKELGEE